MRNITAQEFKDEIFDYDNEKDFKIKSTKPVIAMFSGTWCAPCKVVTPILDEINEEYKNQFNIIKIDVDTEHEIAGIFGIRSIPSILFAPKEGEPDMVVGARSKAQFEKIIDEVLLNPIPQTTPIPVAK